MQKDIQKEKGFDWDSAVWLDLLNDAKTTTPGAYLSLVQFKRILNFAYENKVEIWEIEQRFRENNAIWKLFAVDVKAMPYFLQCKKYKTDEDMPFFLFFYTFKDPVAEKDSPPTGYFKTGEENIERLKKVGVLRDRV